MYRFKDNDPSIELGVRRIAGAELDKMLAETRRIDVDKSKVIHRLRRSCKRLRGLLRLVRPAFADFAVENAAIRDAAALLSSARDVDVLLATLDGMALMDERVAAAVGEAKEQLAGRSAQPGDNQGFEDFREALEALSGRSRAWHVSADGFDAVEPGLAAVYKAARNAQRQAENSGAAHDFHEWRKSVKYHSFHISLLRLTAPELLTAEYQLHSALADLLGEHHDLAVLSEALTTVSYSEPVKSSGKGLHKTVRRRSEILAGKAIVLGNQLQAERPRDCVERLRSYWTGWAVAGRG